MGLPASDQLNALTAAIPGVVYQFLIRPGGGWAFRYISPGVNTLFEISPEEVYADQRVMTECIVPEDRDAHRAAIEASCRSLTPWVHEHRIRTRSGRLKWVRGQALPEAQPDGSVIWNGILVDISDQKAAEAALRMKEELYRAVADHGQALIWMSGTDKGCYYFNRPWLEFTGRTLEQEAGDGWTRGVHPDDLGRCLDTYTEAFDRREPFSMVYRLRRHDGEYRWILDEGTPRHDAAGAFVGYVGHCLDITARKLAEAALQAGESRFRNLLQAIPGVAVQGYGPDGITRFWNRASEEIYGYRAEEAIGRNLLDLIIPPELRTEVRIAIERMFATGEPIPAGELSLMRKDGSRVAVLSSHACVQVPGQAPELFCMDVDLTERKRMEEALRLTRISVEAASDAIFWIARDGRLVDVNAAACRSLGYTRQELLALWIADIDVNHDAQRWPEHFAELRRQGSVQFESAHRTKDGRRIPVEVVANHVRLTKDEEYNCAIVRDISERKLAEEQLRIVATAFGTQEGMFITDADGVILRVNNAFTEITGYAAEDAVGQTPRLLKSGRQDAAFYRTMFQSIRQRGVWRGEIWNRRKNGVEYPQWLTITAIKAEDGSIGNYVATLTDITQRKAAEEEIKTLAFFDPLTGLPNRRLLLDRLEKALAASARHQRSGAILFIDLDSFKLVNDSRGHHVGDLLLQEVARRLSNCIRQADLLARLGGDEFVIMLEYLDESPQLAAPQAQAVAEKILAALGEGYVLEGRRCQCTPSIGIALFRGQQPSGNELIEQADAAMYRAKQAGRNRVQFADPEPHSRP